MRKWSSASYSCIFIVRIGTLDWFILNFWMKVDVFDAPWIKSYSHPQFCSAMYPKCCCWIIKKYHNSITTISITHSSPWNPPYICRQSLWILNIVMLWLTTIFWEKVLRVRVQFLLPQVLWYVWGDGTFRKFFPFMVFGELSSMILTQWMSHFARESWIGHEEWQLSWEKHIKGTNKTRMLYVERLTFKDKRIWWVKSMSQIIDTSANLLHSRLCTI